MLQAIEAFILSHFNKETAVFILAMLPLVEIKGAIPFGILLKMGVLETTLIAFLGSMMPVYPVLRLTPWIFSKLLRVPLTEKLIVRLHTRAMQKSDKIQKFGYWGLFLFVAIPIPGTGVWMGALIASILELYRTRAFFVILIGNGISAFIIYLLSTGILTIF